MKKLVAMLVLAIMMVLCMTACSKNENKAVNEMTLDEMIDYVDQNLDKSFKEDENFIFYSIVRDVNNDSIIVTQVEKVINFENEYDRYLGVVITYDANGEMIDLQSEFVIDYDGTLVKRINEYANTLR